jgi:hypothetical protein
MYHSTTTQLFTGLSLAFMVMGGEYPRACKAVEQLVETPGCQLTECRLGGLSTVLLGSEEGVRFETRGDLLLLDHECDAKSSIPGLFSVQRQKLQALGFVVEGPAQVQENFGVIVFQKDGHWLELTGLLLEGAPSVSLRSVRTEKGAVVRRLDPLRPYAGSEAAVPVQQQQQETLPQTGITAGKEAEKPALVAAAVESPQPLSAKLVSTSDQSSLPKVVSKSEAVYPPGVETPSGGAAPSVVVEVAIDEKGSIARILSTKGNPALLTAALQSVRSWTFEPALASGKPVLGVLALEVNFKSRH